MSTPAAAIAQYLTEVDKLYRAGNATEHSYRPALKTLLENITTELTITNEPKHIDCGAPDYIIAKSGIPLGYIEAKDIKVGIQYNQHKEQFDRYTQSLNNLIITDYLTFQLFVDGKMVVSVSIASVTNGGIAPGKKQFTAFLELINQFTGFSGNTIYSSEQLAKMMADKAKLLASVICEALLNKNGEEDTLTGELETFREYLIPDMTEVKFADMYAQTLAYGLFAARLNQSTEQQFSRLLAAQLIPQSNPFLRNFFQYIAGFNLDARICWIVDALADLFNCVSVEDIKKEFENTNQDPYIHFYETFLTEYNPKLREGMGVYYTPLPVVKFIVRAIDDILKNEFKLSNGLADHSKIKKDFTQPDGSKKTLEFHRVQILDPATGTGTFLAEVIETIHRKYASQSGMWKDYCGQHLIPRLNGFEILMASYAMAHFKMDMTLKETGYTIAPYSRLQVFLTNSLEEPENIASKLPMAVWLSHEANEANKVKRDTPVMVVLGNPPYNVSSQNKGKWIDSMLADYKTEPGTKDKLQEQKLNLDDDYVKFLRFGQMLVEKNTNGILAFINNHSFLDNPTFRGMRWNLLQAFDLIYILDLHGNTKRKETAPGGGKDENVFDIQIGVSINIFIKKSMKNQGSLADVYHADIFGLRKLKYGFLLENTIAEITWKKLSPDFPFYFFVPKNFSNQEEYNKGFCIKDLFPVTSPGLKTERDGVTIHFTENSLNNILSIFHQFEPSEIRTKLNLGDDSRDWKVEWAKKDLITNSETGKTLKIQYRPFDYRFTFYTGKSKEFIGTPGHKAVKQFLNGDNIGLIFLRNMPSFEKWSGIFITSKPVEFGIGGSFPGNTAPIAPLYLYPDENNLDKTEQRRPNLNMDIVNKIADKINLAFTDEKQDDELTFAPIDIVDYIYAILYSNNYRQKYAEFLKIDFPRVPYPESAEQFYKLSAIGSMLRNLHLMETVTPTPELAMFPVDGSNIIESIKYKDAKIYINKTQYFDNVPVEIWEYYIGGYQPAQKWLKDHKELTLDFSDKEHYQKIIAVIKTTIDLQQQIDEVIK